MSPVKEILLLAHSLANFVVGTEGNISAKFKNGFLIKSSGSQLKTLTKKELIFCDKNGIQINNFSKKPSIETAFHSWLLQQPNIKYIAHTHPVNTLKILCTDYIYEFANKRLFPDHVVFNDKKACVVPYSMPGTELAENIINKVLKFQKKEGYFPKLILLQNHGIICCGTSSKECIVMTEICEKAAQIYTTSKILKKINFISEEEILKIKSDEKEKYRKKIIA